MENWVRESKSEYRWTIPSKELAGKEGEIKTMRSRALKKYLRVKSVSHYPIHSSPKLTSKDPLPQIIKEG